MNEEITEEGSNDVAKEPSTGKVANKKKDRPLCGTLWYLAFVLLAPVDIIVSKILFNRIPTLGAF